VAHSKQVPNLLAGFMKNDDTLPVNHQRD